MTYQAKVLTPWKCDEGRNDMLVAEEYPAAWTDLTWQADPHIGADKLNRLIALGEGLSEAQVTALQADTRFAVLWLAEVGGAPPADFTPEQVDTVRGEVAAVLSPDVAKLVTEDTTSPDAITEAVKGAVLRPPWEAGLSVVAGAVYYYAGNLYEVIQAHKTQSDWTPNIVPALFKRYYEPSDDPWPFVAPTGAHDSYPLGARVLHTGHIWTSLIDANVWEPGTVGTENLWHCEDCEPPAADEWAPWVAYTIGQRVFYGGLEYECRQSHTSQPGWEPPNVLALWLPI
ncbi:MAG: hypothetical protein M5U29_07315 [Anaerolineae bacterium]|nr:hypothetical protein [Anaerolineae bacterium]